MVASFPRGAARAWRWLVTGAGGVLLAAAVWQFLEGRRVDASHTYPTAAAQAMRQDCERAGGWTAVCSCAVERLQAGYQYGAWRRFTAEQRGAAAASYLRDCVADSHDFGPAFAVQFREQCRIGEVQAASCECMLNVLQQRFTRREYADVERRVFSSGTVPQALADALAPCEAPG